MRQNIISVRFKNILSFRDENTVSFLADSKYHSKNDAPEKWNLIEHESLGKEKILPVVGLYGHNASGKSNLLKVNSVLGSLLNHRERSFRFAYSPFLLNDDSRKDLSEIEVETIVNDIYYDYAVSFSYMKNEIVSETLSAAERGGKVKKLYAKDAKGFHQTAKDFVPSDAVNEIKSLEGRRDLTVLEILHLRGLKVFTNLYNSLNTANSAINFEKHFAKLYEDPAERKRIVDFIKEIDVGITDIEIRKTEIRQPPSPLSEKILLPRDNVTYQYIPVFIHSGYSIPFESDGTWVYFLHLLIFADYFINGGIVIADEIERSLHPLILRKTFKMFHDKNINKAGAQLLFSSHDVSVLKSDVFRRDEIYFTEKENDGSSSVYPMSMFKGLRGVKDYAKYYLDGYFGAVMLPGE